MNASTRWLARLGGGTISDRPTAGANLRPALDDAVEANNTRINEAFTALRDVIDPDKGIDMSHTKAALEGIARERRKARLDPTAGGLEDVARLVELGGSDIPGMTGFNGIQRARSEIGSKMSAAPNQGYNMGDLKRVYGAMTSDMRRAARNAAREDVHPDAAEVAFENANRTAERYIEANKSLHRLASARSDEGMVGSVVNAARGNTGNAALLRQLREQLSEPAFNEIAGVGLHELGKSPRTGKFSLESFGTNWRRMSDDAKEAMFSPEHRKRLDRFAALDEVLKGSDKYLNKSQTAHSTLTGALIAEGTHAGASLLTGDVMPAVKLLGTLGGGAVVGRALARPAKAASIEKWIDALSAHNRRPSATTRAKVKLATVNLASNLADVPGFDRKEFDRTFAKFR